MYAVSISKTALFQTKQFNISTQFSSIWPIDRTLSDATTPGQSGPGINSDEGVLRISQSSNITETSLSDYLVSYPDTHWGSLTLLRRCSRYQMPPLQDRVNLGGMVIPESSSITRTLPSDCLESDIGQSLSGGVLLLCREVVGVFYSPIWLGKMYIECLPGKSIFEMQASFCVRTSISETIEKIRNYLF